MATTDGPIDLGDIEEGIKSPLRTIENLRRTEIVRYAGASGDFNRLHHDEPYATEAGFPSVIAHGMLVAGFGATLVEEWLGLRRIDEFGTRFSETVVPGDTLTARATVTDVSADGRVEADIEVRNQDDTVVLSGWVSASESA